MASSALKSALRSTACMQAADLKTILHRRLTERRRRSVGNCGATPGRPRSGREATSLFELSNWPSADAGGMSASSWRASRTCGTAWAKALRWDIPRSRSLADWRCNMVASSSAMSQSTVSSIIVRPRRITGISCCHTAKRREGDTDAAAATSSNNGARSSNGPPRSKVAERLAIGKPTSCCSPNAVRSCCFFMNDKPASTSFTVRPTEKRSPPPKPSLVNSASFQRLCAKPSASTTETSSPSITDSTRASVSKPSSVIPIVHGKKAAWKTPSDDYVASYRAKPISTSSRLPISGGMFTASTTLHANAWTSRPQPRHSLSSNQPLHFKRESIPRMRGV
jgi:hypothetical protein